MLGSLRMRQRAAALLAVALTLTFAQASGAAAPTTVDRLVTGAQTARFTVKTTTEIYWGVTSDRAASYFGFTLSRVGGDPYAVDLVPRSLGPEARMAVNVMLDGGRGILVERGTYDLTLFSLTTTRLRVTFKGSMQPLHFVARPLRLWTAESAEKSLGWSHDFPVGLSAVPHAVFVYLHDEWTGDGRNSQTACRGQDQSCSASYAETLDQLVSGFDGVPGPQRSTYSVGMSGLGFAAGANTVSVHSLVAGTPSKRGAVVLVVP